MSAQIEEIGRLVFEVKATTSDDMRTVDLCENSGVGRCSCWAWAKFIGPAIKNLKPNFTKIEQRMDDKYSCSHLRIARAYIADRVVQQVLAAYPDGTTEETV